MFWVILDSFIYLFINGRLNSGVLHLLLLDLNDFILCVVGRQGET
jgi:uncharacterized membrane protein